MKGNSNKANLGRVRSPQTAATKVSGSKAHQFSALKRGSANLFTPTHVPSGKYTSGMFLSSEHQIQDEELKS